MKYYDFSLYLIWYAIESSFIFWYFKGSKQDAIKVAKLKKTHLILKVLYQRRQSQEQNKFF